MIVSFSACDYAETKRTDVLYFDEVVGYFESDVENDETTEIRLCSNDGDVLYSFTKQNEDEVLYERFIKELELYTVSIISGSNMKTYRFTGAELEYISHSDTKTNKVVGYELYISGEKAWETTVSVNDDGRYMVVSPRFSYSIGKDVVKEFFGVTVKEYSADDVLISELVFNQDFSLKKYTEYLYDENMVNVGDVRFDENKERIYHFIDVYVDEYDTSKGGKGGGTHTLKTLNGFVLGTATWNDAGRMTESNITAE